MKPNQVVLVFLVLFLTLFAEAWRGLEKANWTLIKENGTEWHCYERLHKVGPLAKNGIARIKGMCAIAICQTNRDVRYKGCPRVKIYNMYQSICDVIEGDLSKDYPDCCFEIKCEGSNPWEKDP